MIKKFLLFLGIVVVVLVLGTGVTVATAVFGKAQKCPSDPGPRRSDKELLNLIETNGLTIGDSEATALIQKSLSEKIEDPRVCFSQGLAHLSGNIKTGGVSPSFYVSTGLDLSGPTPKTKDLDIRIGSIPNLFIFNPIEKIIEGIINDNLSQMKVQGKYSVEFNLGAATIKKVR